MASNQSPLSVVVPVGPAEEAWRELADRVAAALPDAELVLSAAGPAPDRLCARRLRWIRGEPGRAVQFNRGIQAASGRRLWLLHADSRPDPTAFDAASRFAERLPDDAIGWFDLAFSPDGPVWARLNAAGANLRSRYAGLPFGDQGWMMRRSVFESVGGFDAEFGRGEDLEFIVRATARGVRLLRIGARLQTSARRYREQGWLNTTAAHGFNTLTMLCRARARLKETVR